MKVSQKWGYPNSWMVDFMENPTIKWMIWGDHDETETSINMLHPQVIPETCRLGTGEAAESPTSESDAPSENSESPAGRPSNGSCRSVDRLRGIPVFRQLFRRSWS